MSEGEVSAVLLSVLIVFCVCCADRVAGAHMVLTDQHTHTKRSTHLADGTVSHYDAWYVSGCTLSLLCLHLMLRVAAMVSGEGGVNGKRTENGAVVESALCKNEDGHAQDVKEEWDVGCGEGGVLRR